MIPARRPRRRGLWKSPGAQADLLDGFVRETQGLLVDCVADPKARLVAQVVERRSERGEQSPALGGKQDADCASTATWSTRPYIAGWSQSEQRNRLVRVGA